MQKSNINKTDGNYSERIAAYLRRVIQVLNGIGNSLMVNVLFHLKKHSVVKGYKALKSKVVIFSSVMKRERCVFIIDIR